MTTARLNLEREFEERLELIRVEAEGRTAAMRAKLEEAARGPMLLGLPSMQRRRN